MARLQRMLKRGLAGIGAAAVVSAGLLGFSTAVYADPYYPGEITGFWAQFVVQNGSDDNSDYSFKWMNDEANTIMGFPYQTAQHYVMNLNAEIFAAAVDNVSQISLVVGCDSVFTDKDTDQVNLVISGLTLYFDGYDPITVADFSSEAAGLNMLPSNRWISYNIASQIPVEGRGEMLRHIDRIEFDLNVEYAYFADAPEATPPAEVPTEEPTPEPTEEPTPEPTEEPTPEPTPEPTEEPTPKPTEEPTPEPTEEPTPKPTEEPTPEPTEAATPAPSDNEDDADDAKKPATSDDEEEGGNTVRMVVTIVAAVILLGACVGVGIVFVKKNRLV